MEKIEEKLESLTQQFRDLSQIIKEYKDKESLPILKKEDIPYHDLFMNNGKVLFDGVGEYKVVVYAEITESITLDGKTYPLRRDEDEIATYMIMSFPLTEHNLEYLNPALRGAYKNLVGAKISIANDPDHTYDLEKFADVHLFRTAADDPSKKLEEIYYERVKQ